VTGATGTLVVLSNTSCTWRAGLWCDMFAGILWPVACLLGPRRTQSPTASVAAACAVLVVHSTAPHILCAVPCCAVLQGTGIFKRLGALRAL